MSKFSIMFRFLCGRGDKKRDKNLRAPEDVVRCTDIPYAKGGKYHLLDIYYPKIAEEKMPVIVSVHGGGYVYGTKEVYQHYGMYLSQLGFVFVNFNYHLAPEKKFPTQLSEIAKVFDWMTKNADQYHMDLERVFLVGDSAGAQMASQFAAIYSNPEYAKLFPFQIPKGVTIRAIALNCGLYDISETTLKHFESKKEETGMNTEMLMRDYLGKDKKNLAPMLDVLANITPAYPPTFIMTAQYDFLRELAKPMYEHLKGKGIAVEYHLYGKEGQEHMCHVFHVNMNLEEAKECNKEECEFFRKYM